MNLYLSDSSDNQSYSKKMQYDLKQDTLSCPEDAWVHYLQDHRELIRENSEVVVLTEQEMRRYAYRIRDFLAYKKLTPSLTTAFRVVNRLHNDMDFTLALHSVYLPKSRYINELYRQYNTNKNQYAKL